MLGLIGAGGIGQLLFETLNAFDYHHLSAIVIVIIVAVTLIDLLPRRCAAGSVASVTRPSRNRHPEQCCREDRPIFTSIDPSV